MPGCCVLCLCWSFPCWFWSRPRTFLRHKTLSVSQVVTQVRRSHGTRSVLLTVAPSGLAGFAGLRRVGPNPQYHPPGIWAHRPCLGEAFNPAIADCGYRAPLAPRLARPQHHGRPGVLTCQMQGVRAGINIRRGNLRCPAIPPMLELALPRSLQ